MSPHPLQVPPPCLAVLDICLQEWLPWVSGVPLDSHTHFAAGSLARQMWLPVSGEQQGPRQQNLSPIPTRLLPVSTSAPAVRALLREGTWGETDCSPPPAQLWQLWSTGPLGVFRSRSALCAEAKPRGALLIVSREKGRSMQSKTQPKRGWSGRGWEHGEGPFGPAFPSLCIHHTQTGQQDASD